LVGDAVGNIVRAFEGMVVDNAVGLKVGVCEGT
jgi:hypothetical protein